MVNYKKKSGGTGEAGEAGEAVNTSGVARNNSGVAGNSPTKTVNTPKSEWNIAMMPSRARSGLQERANAKAKANAEANAKAKERAIRIEKKLQMIRNNPSEYNKQLAKLHKTLENNQKELSALSTEIDKTVESIACHKKGFFKTLCYAPNYISDGTFLANFKLDLDSQIRSVSSEVNSYEDNIKVRELSVEERENLTKKRQESEKLKEKRGELDVLSKCLLTKGFFNSKCPIPEFFEIRIEEELESYKESLERRWFNLRKEISELNTRIESLTASIEAAKSAPSSGGKRRKTRRNRTKRTHHTRRH